MGRGGLAFGDGRLLQWGRRGWRAGRDGAERDSIERRAAGHLRVWRTSEWGRGCASAAATAVALLLTTDCLLGLSFGVRTACPSLCLTHRAARGPSERLAALARSRGVARRGMRPLERRHASEHGVTA